MVSDASEEERAAAVIQKHIRGRFGRRQQPGLKSPGLKPTSRPRAAVLGVGAARLLDHDVEEAPIVSHRLINNLGGDSPWGEGHLIRLANKHESDPELAKALLAFVDKRWRSDAVRSQLMSRRQLVSERPTFTAKASLPSQTAAADKQDVKFRADTRAQPNPILGGRLSLAFASAEVSAEVSAEASSGDSWDELETWGDVMLHGRGANGETALHMLFLLDTPACRRLIHWFVPWLAGQKVTDAFDRQVGALDATYLAQPFYGEVALHFAVVHRDLPMVKLLVEHGATLSARASGDFFYSNPQLYYGGTLLGFAACVDSKPIVDFLLTSKHSLANPNGRDLGPESARGVKDYDEVKPESQKFMIRDNSILHCLVLHERADMYGYLVKMGANPFAVNSENQTPLLLAAACGSKKMVEAAIRATSLTLWTYGPIRSVKVPLYEVEHAKETKLIGHKTSAYTVGSRVQHAKHGLGTISKTGLKSRRQSTKIARSVSTLKAHKLMLVKFDSGEEYVCSSGELKTRRDRNRRRAAKAASKGAPTEAKERKTILQLINSPEQTDLLYVDILWRVIKGKWECFGRSIFLWFSAMHFCSLLMQMLAMCSSIDDEDTCEGIVQFFFIPIPIRKMPVFIGDLAYAMTLINSIYQAVRVLATLRNLGRSWRQMIADPHAKMELCTGALQLLSLPLRLSIKTIAYNRVILGICACLGWIRFMKASFMYSPTLGPLLKMVMQMLANDVAQWLVLYLCFFSAFQALLLGIMAGIRGENAFLNHTKLDSQYEVLELLFRHTIGPSTADVGWGDDEVPSNHYEYLFASFLGLSILVWIVLGSLVLLNLLIAMMGNTYAQLYQRAESEWRYAFWQLVLFQEATPSYFLPPFKSMNRRNRPAFHVRGSLNVLSAAGTEAEVECWFLHVELRNEQETEVAKVEPDVAGGQEALAREMASLKRLLQKGSESKVDAATQTELEEAPPAAAAAPQPTESPSEKLWTEEQEKRLLELAATRGSQQEWLAVAEEQVSPKS